MKLYTSSSVLSLTKCLLSVASFLLLVNADSTSTIESTSETISPKVSQDTTTTNPNSLSNTTLTPSASPSTTTITTTTTPLISTSTTTVAPTTASPTTQGPTDAPESCGKIDNHNYLDM